MTHKIAKDIEKSERKRRIDPSGQEDSMDDTGAQGSQEEQEKKAPKKVRFNEDDQEEELVESEMADTNVAQSGSSDGAAAQGDKRKSSYEARGEALMALKLMATRRDESRTTRKIEVWI